MKVLSLGSICLDILMKNIQCFPEPNRTTQIDAVSILGGGGALNTSIALKRLGVDVYPMGEIGNDYAGNVLLDILKEENLNASYILKKDDKPTSIVGVLINEKGERSFICNPGNFIHIYFKDYNWELLKDFDVLAIGSCFLLEELLPEMPELLKKCREYNVTSVVDTVWPTRPTYKLLEKSLPYIDYFTPSLEEAKILTEKKTPEEISKWCSEKGSKNIIIKMDKQGSYIHSSEIQTLVPGLNVETIDSTGAGDCFLAGFVKGLELGYDIVQAVKLGNATGAMCVESVGAYSGITNFFELQQKYFQKFE